MSALLVSLLTLLAPPTVAADRFAADVPPMAMRCEQRPMMGDPHGPPSVCVMNDEAVLEVRHGSCGSNCKTHEPTNDGARPAVTVRFDFACQESVKILSYRMLGWQRRSNVARNEEQSSLSLTRDIHPFSADEVKAACARALGGSWPKTGKHANSKPKVETRLEKIMDLFGECVGSDEKRQNRSRIQLVLTCKDEDF